MADHLNQSIKHAFKLRLSDGWLDARMPPYMTNAFLISIFAHLSRSQRTAHDTSAETASPTESLTYGLEPPNSTLH